MNRVWFVLCSSLIFSAVSGQEQEFASDCPEPNGFFADAYQCDKYYACVDGLLTERLCPDGMVFNDINTLAEKCDYPFHIDCTERPERQTSRPSKNCPRQNGYFAHEDPSICDEFFFCSSGIGSKVTCPESLVFSLKTGTCVWSDQADRVDCKAKDLLNFTCPKVSFDVAVAHPRYADSDDCQYFFVCINGEVPRRNGCKFGSVFNTETTACDEPRNVPECRDFYKAYFEEFFSDGGTSGSSRFQNIDILAAAIASGFDIPNRPARVKISTTGTKPRRRKPTDTTSAAADIRTVAEPPPVQREPAPVKEVPSRRFPSRTRGPAQGPPSRSETPVQSSPSRSESPAQKSPARPSPSGDGPNRRRPFRKRPLKTQPVTTTTTTTTEISPIDYEYYYYDDPKTDPTTSTIA